MEEYIIIAQTDEGISKYCFDNKETAMEIVRMLKEHGVKYSTDFDVDKE